MRETLQSLIRHRPYGVSFEFGYMFEDIEPSPHALLWDSPPYIAAIQQVPKIEIRTLRVPVTNSAVPFVPTVCFWFHGERVYCAYIDFRSMERNQPGVTSKFLRKNADLKIVLVDREVTNCRRMTMKNPLFSLAERVIVDLAGREWFSTDFLEARLRIESEYYETQLWDMGKQVVVDLDSIAWDPLFSIEQTSPPLFIRYTEGINTDSEKDDACS